MKYKTFFIPGLAIIITLLGCKYQQGSSEKTEFTVPDSLALNASSELHQEAMEGIIENLASPVEVAAMLNDMGVPYFGNILVSTEIAEDLTTNFQKALMLGVLSADLGYLNIYRKNTSIIDYISSIKYITDELKVGQFYDFTTLKRLSENKHDLDSLMYISVRSFNQMNSYLEKTHRTNISSLVITGLWLEGFYLATQVAKDFPSHEISESIGEQKIIMEDLFSILENHKDKPGFNDLIAHLNLLKHEFDNVEITYEIGEPETVEDENGMLVIIQNEESIVHITDDQLNKIINRTSEIRNHFIKK